MNSKTEVSKRISNFFSLVDVVEAFRVEEPPQPYNKDSEKSVLTFIRALNENKVEYFLVGGFAVVIYGYVRATLDIDLWIKPGTINQEKLIKALIEAGNTEAEYLKNNPLIPGYAQISLQNSGFTLDLTHYLKAFPGDSFKKCYKTAITVNFKGIPVKVINYDDLILEKRILNRTKDQLDVEELEKSSKK